MVEDRPEGVDVRRGSDLVAAPLGLLRRHVGRGAHHGPVHRGEGRSRALPVVLAQHPEAGGLRIVSGDGRCCQVAPVGVVRIEDPGEPPVHDVDLSEAPDHDVVRFQVPVDHALRVGIGHGVARPQDETQDPRLGPVPDPPLEMGDDRLERLAPDQGHGEEHPPPVVDAQLVDGDDPRVVELTRDLRLLEEPEHGRVVGRGRAPGAALSVPDDLHGQVPPEGGIPDPPDLSHASPGDLVDDVEPVGGGRAARQALQEQARGVSVDGRLPVHRGRRHERGVGGVELA